MLIEFQNSFTARLSIKFLKAVIKYLTAPYKCCYITKSITLVLTRMMEKFVVREYVIAYNAILELPPALSFSGHFAYRSAGSTTVAIVSMLHTVTHLLATNPYVIAIAIDFSNAFDSVRRKTFLGKWVS